jgi:hypothetical protein
LPNLSSVATEVRDGTTGTRSGDDHGRQVTARVAGFLNLFLDALAENATSSQLSLLQVNAFRTIEMTLNICA